MSAQKNHRQSEITSDNIYTTGCLCRIKAVSRLIGDTIHVTVEGLSRAKVVRFIQHDNLIAADIVLFDESVNSDKALALRPTISEKLNELINASSRPGIQESLMLIEKAIMSYDYMFKAANLIILKADERQQYIEQEDFEQQCVMLISIINREIELATLSKRIDQRVKEQIDKNQKEYVLREQIRAIRAELGENEQMESDEFRKRLASREFPPAIKAKLETEITRFSALPRVRMKLRRSGPSSIACWIFPIPKKARITLTLRTQKRSSTPTIMVLIRSRKGFLNTLPSESLPARSTDR